MNRRWPGRRGCVRGEPTEDDRAEIARFAEFCRDVGPLTNPNLEAVLKHADYLGLDEATRTRIRATLEAQQ